MSPEKQQLPVSALNKFSFKICLLMNILLLLTNLFSIPTSAIEDKNFNRKSTAKDTAATFHFPEYAYKETSKNEITYREFEELCEQHTSCEHLEGIQKKACVRRCISYSCYQDIYAFDELEEGEIDVRLNSFKGCVIQRTGNTNRM